MLHHCDTDTVSGLTPQSDNSTGTLSIIVHLVTCILVRTPISNSTVQAVSGLTPQNDDDNSTGTLSIIIHFGYLYFS